jgi:GH35 family endo-1,4-beta-xylanase
MHEYSSRNASIYRGLNCSEITCLDSLSTRLLQHIPVNAVVVEHHLKWAPLCVAEPGPLPDAQPSERLGRYDFYYSDLIVDWAVERNMHVKGHVLVWAASSPVKYLQNLEPDQVAKALREHIFTVMGHYRGRISVWDVVNEPLAPDGSLAENVF